MRNVLLNLLFPRAANCLVCGDPRRAELKDSLCKACREKLEKEKVPPESCSRCLCKIEKGKACAFCRKGGMEYLDQAFAPYRYLPCARKLVLSVKFDGSNEGLPILWDAMADALTDRQFDCMVPVPLHQKRKRQRGVNQAMLLCQGLSERTGIPVLDALKRIRSTKPQSMLKKHHDRVKNVENAFETVMNVKNKRILLVDDVRTTGNTARQCARALRKGGAVKVSLCTTCVVWKGQIK